MKIKLKKKQKQNPCRPNVPWWLLELPEGEYTANDLVKFTRQCRPNVYIRMKALQVERILIPKPNKKLKPNVIFIWKGAKFYQEKLVENMKNDCKNEETPEKNNCEN